MKKKNADLCQLCGKEPWKHEFGGLTPARIGDACLKRAEDIRDNPIDETDRTPAKRPKGIHSQTVEGGVVLKTREQRAAYNESRRRKRATSRPERKCRGCDQPIVRAVRKGQFPQWCDTCNPWRNKRSFRAPASAAGAVA